MPARTVDGARRTRLLKVLDVVPWRLREAAAEEAGEPAWSSAADPAAADGSVAVACVVVLPADCSRRELDLLGRALSAAGPALARAARIAVRDGQLEATVPMAASYLVLGNAQAQALGRELPAAVMQRAQIVLADEPARVLAEGAAKRRLWSALRSLRRTLASGQG